MFDQSAGGNVWTAAALRTPRSKPSLRAQPTPRPGALPDQQARRLLHHALPPAHGITSKPLKFRRPASSGCTATPSSGPASATTPRPAPVPGRPLASNKFTYYGTSELGGQVYFTGFNEEGFSVSHGVEDIQTGEVLSAEQINAPDIGLMSPTSSTTSRSTTSSLLRRSM